MSLVRSICGGLGVLCQLFMIGGILAFLGHQPVKHLTEQEDWKAAFETRNEQVKSLWVLAVLFLLQLFLFRIAGQDWHPITIHFGDFM